MKLFLKNGYFSTKGLYGACTKVFEVITFKYSKKEDDFFLHSFGTDEYDCNEMTEDGEIVVHETRKFQKDFGEIRFSEFESLVNNN